MYARCKEMVSPDAIFGEKYEKRDEERGKDV
jgi:hypothetical protein